ncbi:MAG: glycosyltransferase [Peptococcaceae bacterium]|nr:glycosyltransferase [Peptococcaceae bacterium]
MNIAFDMCFTKSMSNQRGIGRYSSNMIQYIKNYDKNNFYFYFYPEFKDNHLEKQLKSFIAKNAIDIFHFTSPFEANTHRMMKKEWFGNTKIVVTLYDIIPLIFSGAYLQIESDIKKYAKVLDFIRVCDAILAISETTKIDAITYAKMDPNKIKVILGGVDAKFKVYPTIKPPSQYGITKPYVIYTGGDDYRKNLQGIIQAFAKVNRFLEPKYQLVLVGDISKERLYHVAAKAELSKEDLIFTGYVSDEDLVKLYNCAELFIYPSFYEGLGLPVLEAMACGVPVLTSNTSSLNEISGNAAYKVNPGNLEEIVQGLLILLKQPNIRNLYRQKGLEHVKKFQWLNVAQRTIEVYHNLQNRETR